MEIFNIIKPTGKEASELDVIKGDHFLRYVLQKKTTGAIMTETLKNTLSKLNYRMRTAW